MTWPFKKKEPEPRKLVFKNGQGFFEYQCKFGYTSIELKTAIPAIVLDAKQELKMNQSVSIGEDGEQIVMLRVASKDGGFVVLARTPSKKGDVLQPGDIVLWVPYAYSKEAGAAMKEPRSAWVGMIRAKVKPEIDVANPSFDIISQYD